MEDIKAMSQQINSAPTLSNNYYNLYELLYNSDRHKSNLSVYTEMIWDNGICNNRNSHESSFEKAAKCFPQKYGMYAYPSFKLSWPFEKFTKPEKCFDFAEYKQNEYLKKEFPEAFIKDIESMNDTVEILNYFVFKRGPTFYSKHTDRLDKEVKILREKIDNK